ncbi:sensor histidine kinase [Lewinella sp. W8]|uniref:sensor histidine kinase n=1 Tax=Lewinella sp. W8 TaxID=2528208 RepID=UPI0015635E67
MVVLLALLFLCPELLPGQSSENFSKSELLAKTEGLLSRYAYDSVSFFLLPLVAEMDTLGVDPDPVDLKLQYTLAASWVRQDKREKAITLLLPLWRKGNNSGNWGVAVDAALLLSQLYQDLHQPEESRQWVARASNLIQQWQLDDRSAAAAIRFGTWHSQFGYNDSVRYFADQALRFLDKHDPSIALACAYTLSGSALEESDYRSSVREHARAIPILRQLKDYVTLSDRLHGITLIHYRAGNIQKSLDYNDSTIVACYEAIKADRPETNTLSGAYLIRGRAYRRLNQLDSALYYMRRGYSEEIRYLTNQEREKILEAAEQFKNEEQMARIREQDRMLRFQKFRLTGVLIFTGLIILLSVVMIYFYSRLNRSHDVNLKQARQLSEANQRLKDSLERQTMLQSEIHHRVKNNLQVIISLLELQKLEMSDRVAAANLEAMSGRIFSMAALHDLLYLKDGEEVIDIHLYTLKLCDYLSSMTKGTAPEFQLDIPSILFNLETLMPIGIILNELLTNSLKYANRPGHLLRISIQLQEEGEAMYRLRYQDNGPGFPEGTIPHREGGLGKYLLEKMTQQLRGTLESSNDNGATFSIVFYEKVTAKIRRETSN